MILASEQHAEREVEPPAPPMSSYTPEVERLDGIHDAIQQLIAVTLAAAGVKNVPKVKPRPRPRTARDDVQHRIRTRKHDKIVAMFGAARPPADG